MKHFFFCMSLLITAWWGRSQTLSLDSTTLEISIAIDSTKLVAPWDIEWGFDNRLWMTDAKAVKAWDPVTGAMKTIYRFARGYGMGLAVPKVLPATGPIYFYAVFDTAYYYAGSPTSRLYRFEYDPVADTVVATSMLLQYGHISEHSGGKVMIGLDGKLWLTTPEYTYENDTVNALNGRVLRMNIDGSAASGNLRPDRTYTIGHRNAQGMVQLPDGKVYASEHSGPSLYDEVNLITPDGNYGWPAMQGADNCTMLYMDSCSSATFLANHKPPAYIGTLTPAGLDYYDHPAIPEWRNCLLVSTLFGADSCLAVLQLNDTHDTVRNRRNYLKKNVGGINDFQRTRDVCVAGDGSIYYIVLDRAFTNIGDSLVNLRTRIMRVKNNAYVPPPAGVSVINSEGIHIYPNPADDKIIIELPDGSFRAKSYRITDMYGRIVSEGQTDNSKVLIDSGKWPAGQYLFVINAMPEIVRKLIVIH